MPRPRQLELPTWGGRRKGAGRKPNGARPLVSHKPRERFGRAMPVHVSMCVRREVWNLRSARSFRRLRRAFGQARDRFGTRLIEFSVQGNHLHLIVEADGTEDLSRAMQGLAIRIAKALNAMMRRAGRVFADHYFSRLLRTPAELANAIRYVLQNHAHHYGHTKTDPFSSAALDDRGPLLAPAKGWLLRCLQR